MKNSNRIIRMCVTAALAGWSASTLASGFALIEQNASGLGNAYSGQAAAAENASTIFFNPAGMTSLPGKQISGAVHEIKPSAILTPSATSAAPLGLAGDAGGDAGSRAYIPNGYFSWQLNPSVWVGLGVTAPFGLKTTYNAGFVGRFQGQNADVKTYDINPSVAYKVNDWMSLGAGLSYQHATVKLNSSANLGVEGLSNLNAHDSRLGFNFGAMFKPGPNTRVGLTYRSVMSYELRGTTQVTTLAGAVVGTPVVTLYVRTPDTYSAAFGHVLSDRWELLGDFTWTNWSTIKDVPIVVTTASGAFAAGTVLRTLNFQFKDTYRLGVGANYKWTNAFMLKLGIAHDKSPVGDANRTVSLPDSDRTWLAIGGKYRVSNAGTLDFGYAHLFVKNGSINQLGGLGAVTGSGNVVGTYRNKVNIVSVQYSHSF